jgi:Na+/proline symporter
VVDYLPAGLVGLLIAIIFLASWGSIAAALNSLAFLFHDRFHRRLLRIKTAEKMSTRFPNGTRWVGGYSAL